MAIKNWVITAEPVSKGAGVRENYFLNMNHANHKHTERAIEIHGNTLTAANIIRNCEAYKLSKQKKGGRPPTDAMEFVLTIPKGIRPTQEQWKVMLGRVMTDVAEKLGVERKDLSNITRAVVHQQDQNESKKGAGDHMHLMIGKFTDDLVYLRELQKKGVLHTMKTSFNIQMLNVMKIDHRSYVSKKKYKGVAKKRAPQWRVKAAREREELKALRKELEMFECKALDKMNAANKSERALNEFYKQAESWLDALENNDKKRSVSIVEQLKNSSESLQHVQLTENNTDAVNKVIDAVNNKHDTNKISHLPKRR